MYFSYAILNKGVHSFSHWSHFCYVIKKYVPITKNFIVVFHTKLKCDHFDSMTIYFSSVIFNQLFFVYIYSVKSVAQWIRCFANFNFDILGLIHGFFINPSLIIKNKLIEFSWEVLMHPPYIPHSSTICFARLQKSPGKITWFIFLYRNTRGFPVVALWFYQQFGKWLPIEMPYD